MNNNKNTENTTETKLALEKAQTMFQIVRQQFFEHHLAVAGLIIISIFIAIALSAELISKATGLDPNRQNVTSRYLQPMEKSILPLDQKKTALEQFVTSNPAIAESLEQELLEKKIVVLPQPETTSNASTNNTASAKDSQETSATISKPATGLVLKELAKINQDTALEDINSLSNPDKNSLYKIFKTFETTHVFGTDEVGRDILIRLIYGTRVSMGVGILVAVASALVGMIVGSIAGYYGGWQDTLLMRLTDALLSLPLIPVLIVVAAIDLRKIPWLHALINPNIESIVKLCFILLLFSWMTVGRLVRGSILSLKEREFILSTKTLGATDSTIIMKHMFPNVIAPMLVSISLGVGESILFEAALSFLGLGIMPPTPSWGNMLNNAQEVIYKNMWLTILPGIMILLTTISFNFIGDGLQDAVDPKAIKR